MKDPTPAPKPEVPCRGENLLATLASTAKQGTSKDFAALLASAALKSDDPLALVFDLAAALVSGSNTPDDVFRAIISGAKDSKALSKPAVRAADAALVILAGSEKPVAKAS